MLNCFNTDKLIINCEIEKCLQLTSRPKFMQKLELINVSRIGCPPNSQLLLYNPFIADISEIILRADDEIKNKWRNMLGMFVFQCFRFNSKLGPKLFGLVITMPSGLCSSVSINNVIIMIFRVITVNFNQWNMPYQK